MTGAHNAPATQLNVMCNIECKMKNRVLQQIFWKMPLPILLSISLSAEAGYIRPCPTSECSGILHTISGGSMQVLAFEIIFGVFIVLWLMVKIHEKWFK